MVRLLAPVLCATSLIAVLATSAAANPQIEAAVDTLIESAYDDYDFLELDAALTKLQEARSLAERHGLGPDQLLEIHLLTGIVAGAGGDEARAIEAFRRALAIDAGAAIHPFYITPTLEALFEQARGLGPWRDTPPPAPTPAPPPAPTPAPPPTATTQISHSAPPGARAGQPLELTARIPVEAPAGRVVISFRPFGEEGFRTSDMTVQPDGVTWRGVIPPNAVQRVQVDYYIQVFDRGGRAIAQVAGPARPNNVPVMGAPERPEDAMRDRDRDRRSRDRGPGDEGDMSSEVFHFGLGVGTGVGLATGELAVNTDVDLSPGMAPTPLHFYTEFGLSPRGSSFHVVPFLRMQLVFRDSSTEMLPLVGLKARHFVLDQRPLRFYIEGGFGYGEVSHLVLNLPPGQGPDTTREGPFHVGVGPGFVLMLGEGVGLKTGLYTMALFDQFSFQIDLNTALYFSF